MLPRLLRPPEANLPVPETTRFRSIPCPAPPQPRPWRRPIGYLEPNYISRKTLELARTWSGASLSWRARASLLFSIFPADSQRERLPPTCLPPALRVPPASLEPHLLKGILPAPSRETKLSHRKRCTGRDVTAAEVPGLPEGTASLLCSPTDGGL